MKDGLKGGPVPDSVPFHGLFDDAGLDFDISPLLLAAIAKQESDYDPNILSADGGHGLMQLTSSFPDRWRDPYVNLDYACAEFLIPIMAHWRPLGFVGDDFVRLVGASYNAGLSGAAKGHSEGDCDLYTTDRYGDRLVAGYHALADLA